MRQDARVCCQRSLHGSSISSTQRTENVQNNHSKTCQDEKCYDDNNSWNP